MKLRRHPSARDDSRARLSTESRAVTHNTLPLPGCTVHATLPVDTLAWMSRTLRCIDDVDVPPPEQFADFHATLRVQTFDDIDLCVKIASTALTLGPIAAIGLRELIVNAVEHGNLEIDFDHKSALLASGEWQNEIEKRLASTEFGNRFAAIELRRDGDNFTIAITDQGPGFNWDTYLDAETAPQHMLHGRGMSLAMEAGFEAVEYRGAGNRVAIRGVCVPVQDT